MRYKVTFPFMDDMGSYGPIFASSNTMETKEENALWDLNSARRHDGLPELKRLPAGTKFERMYN
jgi:hypothetical protein